MSVVGRLEPLDRGEGGVRVEFVQSLTTVRCYRGTAVCVCMEGVSNNYHVEGHGEQTVTAKTTTVNTVMTTNKIINSLAMTSCNAFNAERKLNKIRINCYITLML